MKPILIKTQIYNDGRGFFKELWLKKRLNFLVSLLPCPNQRKM